MIELLAVAFVGAFLLVLVLPALTGRATRSGRPVQCMLNLKQLSWTWALYAEDHGGSLVANRPYVRTPGIPTNSWVAGVMDWSASSQNTNQNLMLQGRLAAYLGKSIWVYHCPADISVSAVGPRVRSYSMNAFMGDNGHGPAVAGWQQYSKLSEIKNRGAIFVFADEHPNSIDDGYFFNDPTRTNAWTDLPAARHVTGSGRKGGAAFGFADGHAEIHGWIEASTLQPVVPKSPKPAILIQRKETGADLSWVLERMTQRAPNSVSGP